MLCPGVKVSIEHQGKDINLSRLAELYLKWLKEMHREYDEEFVFPYLAKAEYIFQQGNCLKDLGMGDSEGETTLTFHLPFRDN